MADMELSDVEQVKFLGTPGYETMQAAKDTISSVPTMLRVPFLTSVPNDLEMPDNIMVNCEGKGQFNVASGKHLQINSFYPVRKQINTGLGMLSFGRNSVEEMDMVYWVGTGLNITLTAIQLAGIFQSFDNSHGGVLLLPQATVTFPGQFLLPGSAITLRGRNSTSLYGTVIKTASNNIDFFAMFGYRTDITLENFTIDVLDRTGVKPIVVKPGTDAYSDSMTFRNLYIRGGTKGIYFDGGVEGRMMTNMVLDRIRFDAQTDVCLEVASPNTGLTIRDSNFTPAWNKVSGCYRNTNGGQVQWEGVNNFNGRNFTLGDHHASFVDGNVNLTTGAITITGHPFLNTNALTTIDVEEVDLSNFGGAFPTITGTPTSAFVRYVDANTVTLHSSEAGVLANTGKYIPSSASGGGTHTLRAITAIWTKLADADINLTTGVITARGHRVPINGIIACSIRGATVPSGWPVNTRLYFRATDKDHGTLHYSPYEARNNFNVMIPLNVGSGTRHLCLAQRMQGNRPAFGAEVDTRSVSTTFNKIQDEGIPLSVRVFGPGAYEASFEWNNCILQGQILFDECVGQFAFNGCNMAAWSITDTLNSIAVVYLDRIAVISDARIGGSGLPLTFAHTSENFPGHLDAFTGSSRIASDKRPYLNHRIGEWVRIHLGDSTAGVFPNEPALTVTAQANDVPLINWGAGEDNGNTIYALWQLLRNGTGVTGKVGWGRLKTTSAVAAERGFDVQASMEIDGSFSNSKATQLGTTGTVSADCLMTSVLDITPTGNVTALNATNIRPGHFVMLRVLSSGSTSYTITPNTGFANSSPIVTGTTTGTRIHVLYFADKADGGGAYRLVEVGRTVSGGGSYVTPTTNAQTGTSYTVQASDNGNIITLDNAASIVVTVPSGLGSGFRTTCIWKGVGQVSFVGSGGAVLYNWQNSDRIAARYGRAFIEAYESNNFTLTGDLATGAVNWARSATITASRSSGSFVPTAANDGLRHTNNVWNPTGGWDCGAGGAAATLELDFGVARTFSHIRLYTLKDSLNYNTDPGPADTFTLYGNQAYGLEYWNGTSWVNIATVTGNNLVRKDHTFAPITASKVRFLSNTVPDSGANFQGRVVEFECWSVDPG